METNQAIPCLDTELLQGYLDSLGKNIVEQMFALYCQQADIYLKDIEHSQQHNSSAGWQEHCHKMKGATASVGMSFLHSKLKVLENTNAQQDKKAIMLAQLKQDNKLAIAAFQHWLVSC